MKPNYRQIILIALDAVLVNLAVYISLLFRFEAHIPGNFVDAYISLIPLITVVFLIFFYALKLYNRIWVYASLDEMLAIVRAASLSVVVIVTVIYLFKLPYLPRSIYFGMWFFTNALIGTARVSWRLLRETMKHHWDTNYRNVLIVGAGDAGAMLVRELQNNPGLGLKAVAIVDDDPSKHKAILFGVPVLGSRKRIPHLVSDLEISEIIIAMPSVTGETVRAIVDVCRQTPARVRILPGVYASACQNLVRNLRDVRMEDLLRREPVDTNIEEIAGYIKSKSVLVTGAGGSIGSELCRQLYNLSPSNLIMVDNCENNLFDIEQELSCYTDTVPIQPQLVDIRERDKLDRTFKRYKPQVVFHAAAYKHVPMMERHPDEAISNNVIGTRNMAEISDRCGVETFIMVSTDKAVNPTSVMGASKRLAELVVRNISRTSKTRFAAVRFGNVLGSRGSVVPTFIKQIEAGGPVTVTHPDMQRYFMTIPEAVQLIIQAGALTKGGEIFVLDMGEMVKIDDLARDLIRLAGYEPDKDIKVVYTGIRPGEKLYEELFTDRENMAATKYERIFISKREMDDAYLDINKTIMTFAKTGLHNRADVLELIMNLLPEYQGGEQGHKIQEKIIATRSVG